MTVEQQIQNAVGNALRSVIEKKFEELVEEKTQEFKARLLVECRKGVEQVAGAVNCRESVTRFGQELHIAVQFNGEVLRLPEKNNE